MLSVFARPKPCKIMTTLKDAGTDWHLSKLAKSTDTTYVYVTKLVSKLEEAEMVTVEPKGKRRIVRLTEKGLKIANAIDELMSSFED
jgi:predicted transcriptional regulator